MFLPKHCIPSCDVGLIHHGVGLADDYAEDDADNEEDKKIRRMKMIKMDEEHEDEEGSWSSS